MKNKPRVFYFCTINTPEYERKLQQRLHVGAATNKVLAVVAALRRVGCQAYPVSLPVLGRFSTTRTVKAKISREQKNLIIYLGTVANPLLRRLFGAMDFAGFCWRMVKKKDQVLLYNFMPEYLPALIVLRLKNNPAIIDIEDAPRTDLSSGREFINFMIYKAVCFLCHSRYLTVSSQVANNFNLQPVCVVYGATQHVIPGQSRRRPENNTFRVLYGGSLCDDTGLTLFCNAVKLLNTRLSSDNRILAFIVTGFGGEEHIEQLRTQCQSDRLAIEKKENLPMEQYQKELLSCDAALCLKMPDSEMGATTFPSKVVEITSTGLLLISTKVSDIPLLFNEQNAVLLDVATPESLCSALLWAMDHPVECQLRAQRGQARALELFAEASVGQRVRDFLFQ